MISLKDNGGDIPTKLPNLTQPVVPYERPNTRKQTHMKFYKVRLRLGTNPKRFKSGCRLQR